MEWRYPTTYVTYICKGKLEKMREEIIEKLTAKFFSGKMSPEERTYLEKWYASSEANEGFLSQLNATEKEELENKLFSKINQNLGAFEKANPHQGKDISNQTSFNVSQYNQRKNSFYSHSYKIAAVLIAVVVIVSAISYMLLNENSVVHSTAYGQMIRITLPDSSMVILNGNSSIKYGKQWANKWSREVYLDGEAFFVVRHTEHDQKFIVNTSEQFNVEVLGTEFSVSKRKRGTRVVLNSGKVLLNIPNPEGNEQVVMKPGELIEFFEGSGDYIKKEVNAEAYSSWKDKKLILDHTSLREILTILRENYGLEVIFVDKDLLDQKVSGSMPAENIDMLLKNIAVTYGIKISKNKNTIQIRKIPKPQASDN